jgi:peptidoglycan/LPS O-acetylase OafA/YrhL
MSGHAAPRRWRSRIVTILFFFAAVAVLNLLARVTGFGDWYESTPAAMGTARVLIILLFGAAAAATLHVGEGERRRPRDWLYAAIALAVAILQTVLLIGGEDAIF